ARARARLAATRRRARPASAASAPAAPVAAARLLRPAAPRRAPPAVALRIHDRGEEALRPRRAPAAHVAQPARLALRLAEVVAQEHRAAPVGARVFAERVEPPSVLGAQRLELAGERARVLLEGLLVALDLDGVVDPGDEPGLLELREQRG